MRMRRGKEADSRERKRKTRNEREGERGRKRWTRSAMKTFQT